MAKEAKEHAGKEHQAKEHPAKEHVAKEHAPHVAKEHTPRPQPKEIAKEEQPKDYKYLVRIHNTDLAGDKQIASAMRKIKGISYSFASAICLLSNVDRQKKAGILTDDEIKRLDSSIKNSGTLLPSWMLNRRKSLDDGMDYHLFTSDLDFALDNDIKLMKKVRSYRGVRHGMAAPVRGQHTRSNFRRNKGKVMGVVKKKVGKAT